MNINIILDKREHFLIEKMKDEVMLEHLEIGDIQYRRGDEIILIIERKTIADLKASICDGRYREQKERLIGNIQKNRIIYLIEGDIDKPLDSKINGMTVSTIIGSLINTQLRDGIKIYKTTSINESVEFLRRLYQKINKDNDKYFLEELPRKEYHTTIKMNKKDNMCPKMWFMLQLSHIPQISNNQVKRIIEEYPNMNTLVTHYEMLEEKEKICMLSNLTYTINNGQSRKIGPVISKRIYEYIYGIED